MAKQMEPPGYAAQISGFQWIFKKMGFGSSIPALIEKKLALYDGLSSSSTEWDKQSGFLWEKW